MFNFLKKKKNDPSYDALVAAFCLVSYADGHLHTAELSRFIRLQVRENPGLITDEDQLMRDIITFGKKLNDDFARGKATALETIAQARGDNHMTQKIMKVAQIAVISDNRITIAEESVVGDIARALGVPFSVE